MARTVASNVRLTTASTPVSAAPFTVACWARPTAVTATMSAVVIGDSDASSNFWRLGILGASGGDPVNFFASGSSGANATTSTGVTVDQWHHLCGVEASATDRRAFVDGGSKGTNATEVTPSSVDHVRIGATRSSASQNGTPFSGDIAEVCIWNVALTDDEVALLAKGVSPFMVRPDSIVFYAPLLGNFDPETDIVGGLSLTLTNSPAKAAHPRVFYPSRVAPGTLPAPVAVGATVTIDADLDQVTAALNGIMLPTLTIASVVERVMASLNAQQRQLVTVGATIDRVTCSLNVSQSHLVTVASVLDEAQASLNVVMQPTLTIASSIDEVVAALAADQSTPVSLTIASSLDRATAALSADQRYLLTIASQIDEASASLAIQQIIQAQIAAVLDEASASLNVAQSHLFTIGSTLDEAQAALSLSQIITTLITSVLDGPSASLNLTQLQLLTIAVTLMEIEASLNAAVSGSGVVIDPSHILYGLDATYRALHGLDNSSPYVYGLDAPTGPRVLMGGV